MSTHNAQLVGLLDPVVTAAGLVLEDVVVTTVGRRRMVRVVVDLPEQETGSADLDRVADVSRQVGDTLDESDALGSAPYALEVTTPGVDRPLTEPRHWWRARTRLVRVERDGQPPLTGRLVAVVEAGPVLDVAGEQTVLPWADAGVGHVEVEFTKRPKPGTSGPDDGDTDGDADSDTDTDDSDEDL